MKASIPRMSLFLLVLVTANFFNNRSLSYQGVASDFKSGKVYFTEEHEESMSDASSSNFTSILYRNPEGETIVKKRIDYSRNLFCPDFIQEDLRDGYLEGAQVKGNEVELKFRKNYQQPIQAKKIEIPFPAVIDGGFNHFLKQHWQELCDGLTVKFYFAV